MGGRESRTDRGWTSQDRDVCQAPRGLSSQGSGHAKRSQRNLETDGVRLPLSSSVQRSLFKATERGLPAPRAGRQVPSPLGLVYGASSRPRAAVMACHRMSQGTRVGRTLHSDPHNPRAAGQTAAPSAAPSGLGSRNRRWQVAAVLHRRALLQAGVLKQPVKRASQQTSEPDFFPGRDTVRIQVPEDSFTRPSSPHWWLGAWATFPSPVS